MDSCSSWAREYNSLMSWTTTQHGSAYLQGKGSSLRVGATPYACKHTRGLGLAPADVLVLPRDPWMRGGTATCALEGDLWAKLFGPSGALCAAPSERDERSRLQVVCEPAQAERVGVLLRNAWEGPNQEELARAAAALGIEPDSGTPWREWHDRMRIRDASGMAIDLLDAVDIVPLDGATTVGEFVIHETAPDQLVIEHAQGRDELDIGRLFESVDATQFPFPVVARPSFDRNRLTVHTLGCYAGTDPAGPTSCFRVTCAEVDLFLDAMSGLEHWPGATVGRTEDPVFLLSHIHEDHFHGVIETIARGDACRLIAAPAVLASFLAVAGAILDRETEDLAKVLDVTVAEPGRSLTCGSAEIDLAWVPGPVPTTAFRVAVGGRSVVYSGDTVSRRSLMDFGFDDFSR